MEEKKDETQGLSDQLKQYIETSIKLARYQAIDKSTSFFASLITETFVLVCVIITLFFATITLALLLGSVFGSYWEGFGCVTLMYLLAAIVVSKTSSKHIEPRIINFLVQKLLKPKSNPEA